MPIPQHIRKKMKQKGFWNQPCVHSGKYGVQAEHAWQYGGKSIQEEWNLVPVAPEYNYNPSTDVKAYSQYCALRQAKDWCLWEELQSKYPKKDWGRYWQYLSQKFSNTLSL